MKTVTRLAFALALVGCSNTITSPAIESTVHPLPLADAGGLVVAADSGATKSPDADAPAPAEDAGSTTPERDAAPPQAIDAGEAPDGRVAPPCVLAPTEDYVCVSSSAPSLWHQAWTCGLDEKVGPKPGPCQNIGDFNLHMSPAPDSSIWCCDAP